MATRFDGALRRAEAGLDLPPPIRGRILAEVASDLDGLFEAYRARGLSDDEAASRAAHALGLDEDAAAALGRLHEPRWRRWTARLSERGRSTAERVVITVLCLGMLVPGALILAGGGFFTDPTPLVWPLLALAAVLLAAAFSLAFRLHVRHETRSHEVWLAVIASAAIVAPVLALVGVVRELSEIATATVAAGTSSAEVLAPGVRRAAQAASLALMIGITAFLAWFHLRWNAHVILRDVENVEASTFLIADDETEVASDR
jgi:hypothetical protein